MNRWIVAKASVIGNRHVLENIPCQDAHGYMFFDEDNFGVAVVSDGAGSAAFSDIGARHVAEKALEKFATAVKAGGFHMKSPVAADWNITAFKTFKAIAEDIHELAHKENIPVRSLAATAIVLIITSYGLLVTHIGDGRAGYLNERGEWHACMKPYKGCFANETAFITSCLGELEDMEAIIESNIVNEPISAFTLLSDGCENTCFELNRFDEQLDVYEKLNNPYPGFYNYNIDILRSLDGNGFTEQEIDVMWDKFLTNGNEQFSIEPDDKTLILGIKKTAI